MIRTSSGTLIFKYLTIMKTVKKGLLGFSIAVRPYDWRYIDLLGPKRQYMFNILREKKGRDKQIWYYTIGKLT